MTIEEWVDQRVITISIMAAILEAGDRACQEYGPDAAGTVSSADYYAHRATVLFDEVDALETEATGEALREIREEVEP